MKILFLGNNWLGWRVLQWLKETGREIVGVVIHPEEKQKYARELLEAADLPPERVFFAPMLKDPSSIEEIKALAPDVGVSVMFDYVLDGNFLALFPKGCFNLHPSYLPYNRGAFANVWAIVDRTPAGVTFHLIDEGIDTGPIVAQKKVMIEPVDTGETLYRKLERAGVELFRETWPRVEAGTYELRWQDPGEGETHRRSDVERIDRIDLDREYRARDLIDILRARTFPPYKGAYFEVDGTKVYMELNLYYEED